MNYLYHFFGFSMSSEIPSARRIRNWGANILIVFDPKPKFLFFDEKILKYFLYLCPIMKKIAKKITKEWVSSLKNIDIQKTIEMEGYNPLTTGYLSGRSIWAKCPLCGTIRRTPLSGYNDEKYCKKHVRTGGGGFIKETVDYNNIPKHYADLFWSRVQKTNEKECWLWTHRTKGLGYGEMTIGGKNFVASRLSWYFTYGVHPPVNMQVCHKCDNPGCCNPNHLFLGTLQDNLQDSYSKGRNTRGEKMWSARMSENEALNILNLYEKGSSVGEISKEKNIPYSTIYHLVTGRSWGHLQKNKVEF